MPTNQNRNIIIVLLFYLFAPHVFCQTISHRFLTCDVRQLAYLLETAHPDPYTVMEGKIAFHRKVQDLLNAIPAGGMTKVDFFRFISPFLASLNNGHSDFNPPAEFWYGITFERPGGIPLRFDIIEESLWVSGVYSSEHENLLGAILVSIEGIPFSEIVERLRNIRGTDNYMQTLSLLSLRYNYLWYRPYIEWLLPEWISPTRLNVEFKLPNGEYLQQQFSLPVTIYGDTPIIEIQSQVTIPSTEKCEFVYEFLDNDKKTALLVVSSMVGYREFFELNHNLGYDVPAVMNIREVYQQYNGVEPPSTYEELIIGIPSATEKFRKLVMEMKNADTETLVVDLSKNQGGDSRMADILTYFLYGKEQMAKTQVQYVQIPKYSQFFFDNHHWANLEEINEGRNFQLTINDYDFGDDTYFRYLMNPDVLQELRTEYEETVALMTTFDAEYQSEAYCNHYCPQNVFVVCSPQTYSSGFTFLTFLYHAGATIVGTPSGQAANSDGRLTSFTLTHSQLSGDFCLQQSIFFHDDPEKGRLLRPDYELTYEKLASYGFDKNAGVIYALELANN